MTSPDLLSRIMIGLACYLTFVALVYGKSSFSDFRKPLLLLLFCASACMASLVSTWFGFVIWVELSSLCLAALVAFSDTGTAKIYFYSQLAGGALLLLGAAAISTPGIPAPLGPVSGTWYPLFLLALGFKAAFPGLHFWLPPTHSRASSEVSLLLSGYAVKMGIYGLLRLVDKPSPGLLWIGIAMALYGVFQALAQKDSKRILAYSTMSQLGFMVTALATGTPEGRYAALFYLVAHALFKGLLFLVAGSLEKLYGTRDLNRLGNIAIKEPLLCAFFLLGAAAIAGFPGTAGYAGKTLVKSSLTFHTAALWSLQLAGLGTVLYLSKFGGYAFFEGLRKDSEEIPKKKNSLPLSSLGAMGLVACPLLLLGGTRKSLSFFFGNLPLPDFWSPYSLGTALLPVAAGLALFSFFPKLFFPRQRRFPDVEDLLPSGRKTLLPPLEALRKFHLGKIRMYFFLYFFVVFFALALFSL
ncbi:MAG TPA: proton-conducting transporter membrane subunit [Synergistaceae bacterium]|nr:proton-conducting transporter membrane subunit [Synergistaceae bacterium]